MFKRFITIGMSMVLVLGALFSATLFTSADGKATPNPAPETIADYAMGAIEEKQHPYLMYESDEIPALKEKITSGNSKKAFEVIGDTVSSCMNRKFTVAQGVNGVVGRQLQYCVMYLSTYSMLTGDTSYAEKAVEQVMSCVGQGNVDVYFAINDALCVADFGYAYALAYDVLADYLTEDEKILLKAEMEDIGAWIYANSPEINTWGSPDENRKAWNWNAVTHGALGMISLSLGDHIEWLTLAIDRAQGYYKYAVDSTGAGMEGLHYLGYALNSLAPLDYAIYRFSGIELLDDFPAFQSMPYWGLLYMTVPQGNEQVKINQGDSLANYSGPYYIINRYRQSDALWAWEHTYGLEGDGQFTVEYHGNGWSAPAVIFFEDQTLTPQKPTEESNPLYVSYDKGLVVARDSWENNASMFTFTCGRGYGGCWNHPDDNSFTFHARGESYIVDLGANYKESKEHNVVLINGKGMDYSGGPTAKVGEILESKVLPNGNIYVAGSNVSSYKKQELAASVRQIVYGGGDVPFLLVFDHVRNSSSSNTFNINFFTHKDVSTIVSGDYAVITGNSGEVCYVMPYSPDGVTMESAAVGSSPCLTTETTGRYLRQVTIFIMAESDGEMPDVTFSTKGKTTTVTITRTVNGQKETETYSFGLEELTQFTTTEEIEIEEESSDIITEDTDEITEPKTDPDGSESETEKDTDNGNNDGGCFSAIGTVAIIPATALGASLLFFRRRKKK